MKYSANIIIAAAMIMGSHSAQAATQKLLIGGFEDVVVEGDMQVNITAGKSISASASGDRKVLERLKTENNAGILKIRLQSPLSADNRIRITQPLIINLSSRNIRNITVKGNARLTVNNVVADGTSKIFIYGGGEIDVGQVKLDKLNVVISGTGKVAIAGGSARETDVQIQGSGYYLAEKMKTRKFELLQNGNGKTSALVEESAIINNDGAGNIVITGNAECLIRRAGLAVIECPDDKKARSRK
jgi:hypothetical protein